MNEPLVHFLAVCPHCAATLRVQPEYAGELVACRHCNGAFRPSPATFPGSSSGEHHAAGPDPAAPGGEGHVAVACPECGVGLRVREKYVGGRIRCGHCKAKLMVPAEAAPASRVTPDPDDPRQGRVEVLRLLGQVAALRARNREQEARIAELESRVAELERRREADALEIARLRAEAEADSPFERAYAAGLAFIEDDARPPGG